MTTVPKVRQKKLVKVSSRRETKELGNCRLYYVDVEINKNDYLCEMMKRQPAIKVFNK